MPLFQIFPAFTSGYTTSTSWPLTILGANLGNKGFDSIGFDCPALSLVLRERAGANRWMTFTGGWSQSLNQISLTAFRDSSTGSQITPDTGTWDVYVSLLGEEIANIQNLLDFQRTVTNLGNVTGNVSINNGGVLYGTVTGDTTFIVTDSFGGFRLGGAFGEFTLILTNAGAHNLTFTNGHWPGGITPVFNTTGVTVIKGMTPDNGATVYYSVPNTVNPIMVSEVAVNLGNCTGNINLDLSLGNYFYGTSTGNTVFTVANPPGNGVVGSFTLELTNGGAHIQTFTNAKWPGGAAPTLTASGVDILSGLTRNAGATVRMALAEAASA